MTKNMGCEYFAQIKENHQELHREAERTLASRKDDEAHASYGDMQNGSAVTYHAWHVDLGESGWLDWTHARQLVRIQRVTEHPITKERSVGNRYYVCSKASKHTSAEQALTLSRIHWRCENERV